MENQFSRTELLIGKENLEKLKKSKIGIFGIGGVGSFVCEALARVGVGELVLIDNDEISISNLNRQIHATHNTIGKPKVEVMKNRILEINPKIKVEVFKEFYNVDSKNKIIDNTFSYIVDAVDTVAAKLEIITNAKKVDVPVISSMGTANKLNPTMLEVADIYKTSVCPLAKVIRKELRNRNINNLKVVYSKEEPFTKYKKDEDNSSLGSISFVPSVAGLIIASEVVKDIIKK